MSNQVFPSLAGVSWPVNKSPVWKTISQQAASGREVRVALMTYPLYRVELTYDIVRAGTINGTAYTELQQLMDFYNARAGMADDFLFTDEDDSSATDMQFGTGNGSATSFQLIRTLAGNGTFAEPIANVNGVPTIKDNSNVVNPANYSISPVGLVTFNTPPVAAHVLTWTGNYYYRCRFDEDEIQFSKFMNSRWELRRLRLLGSLGVKV